MCSFLPVNPPPLKHARSLDWTSDQTPSTQVVERAATNPASTFGFPKGLGTLREGAEADVAVFSLNQGRFEFVDSLGQNRRSPSWRSSVHHPEASQAIDVVNSV